MATVSLVSFIAILITTVYSQCGRFGPVPLDVCTGTTITERSTKISCSNDVYTESTFMGLSCMESRLISRNNVSCLAVFKEEDCVCESSLDLESCDYAKYRDYSPNEDCNGDYSEVAVVTDECFTTELGIGVTFICLSDFTLSTLIHTNNSCDDTNGTLSSETPCNLECLSYEDAVTPTVEPGSPTMSPAVMPTMDDDTMMSSTMSEEMEGGGIDNETQGIIIGAVIGGVFCILLTVMIVFIVIDHKRGKTAISSQHVHSHKKKDDYSGVNTADVDHEHDVDVDNDTEAPTKR